MMQARAALWAMQDGLRIETDAARRNFARFGRRRGFSPSKMVFPTFDIAKLERTYSGAESGKDFKTGLAN